MMENAGVDRKHNSFSSYRSAHLAGFRLPNRFIGTRSGLERSESDGLFEDNQGATTISSTLGN